jgi:hypothetical protein
MFLRGGFELFFPYEVDFVPSAFNGTVKQDFSIYRFSRPLGSALLNIEYFKLDEKFRYNVFLQNDSTDSYTSRSQKIRSKIPIS